MNIKQVISNLKSQLLTNTNVIRLVKDKVFISGDIIKQIETLKIPFINIEFDTLGVNEADNQNLYNYERHTYNINIQFAVSDKDREVVLTGTDKLLDMYEIIYNAIKDDPTLNGVVDSFIKTPSLVTDIFPPSRENLLFIAGGEMSISFNKDIYVGP